LKDLGISFPKILEPLKNNSYCMQYISGMNLGNFLKIASKREILLIQKIISNYFRTIVDASNTTLDANSLLRMKEKLVSLEKNVASYDHKGFVVLLRIVREYFLSAKISAGWNHGDFSLENLIISHTSKSVFAIDLLDSPFDSPYIDLGRFWLDIKYGWWGNGLTLGSNEFLNSRAFEDEMRIEFSKEEIRRIEYFAAFALLRILPYTSNPVRLAFLKSACWDLRRSLA
jgi:hypothetical protein